MEIFTCGEAATARAALRRFISEMDDLGEAYGNSGDDDFDPPWIIVQEGEPHRDLEGDPHAIVALRGRGWASGEAGQRIPIRAGQGAWWGVGETWDLGAVDEPLVYIEVEGPLLRPAHQAVP